MVQQIAARAKTSETNASICFQSKSEFSRTPITVSINIALALNVSLTVTRHNILVRILLLFDIFAACWNFDAICRSSGLLNGFQSP